MNSISKTYCRYFKLAWLLPTFLFFYCNAQAQYSETFGTPDKGYKINCVNDFTGINWSLTPWDPIGTCQIADLRDPSDYFNTTGGGVLQGIDLDQEVCWLSPLLDVTGSTQFSEFIAWNGFDPEDYLTVYQSFDAGPFEAVPNLVGGGAGTIQFLSSNNSSSGNIVTPISMGTTTLQIRICAYVNENDESISIDNVMVPGASVLVCPPGNILYVNDNATGANNGTSWTHAFNNLQDALTKANECANITQIWVAAGTYKPDQGTGYTPGTRTHSFVMKDNLAIYGGFAGGENMLNQRNWITNLCTLSGEIGAGGNADNSYHVLNNSGLNNTAVLDGFTITAGNGSGSFPNDGGGGMFNSVASPTINNCIFSGNSANAGGGGMYNNTSSNPIINNCAFTSNTTNVNGGAMYNASASPVMTNCSFSGNSANGSGGAVFNTVGGTPGFFNCTFSGNQANSGGAMYNNNGPSPNLTNCSFSGNSAGAIGGAMNNSFASPNLYNCILWGNSSEMLSFLGTPTLSNCLVQGGCPSFTTCTNVQNVNPLFVSQPPVGLGTTGDLRLTACSPAIDAGNDADNGTTTDLDGNARKFEAIPGGQMIDLGAYEFQSAALVLVTCYADTDMDGYGNPSVSMTFCNTCGSGFVPDNTDCDDGDDEKYPGNPEVCDGKDNDCNGMTDEGLSFDVDGDGYTSIGSCLGSANDCNDNDDEIFPGNPEVCDGKDNDCNGQTDEGLTFDVDGDGYTSIGSCQGSANDCNDNDDEIFPGNPEVCDGKDNDCNGQTDEGLTFDVDGDGYTSIGSCLGSANDCDDNDDEVFPGNPEVCDGKDNDCNGQTDEGLTFDVDGDGYTSIGSCLGSANDCDDLNDDVYPFATEICDGLDNDCDGMIDEGLTFDLDGDGYTSIGSCQGSANDCNDNDDEIFPGNPEVCDGKDNDCNGMTDEGLTFDADGDGYTSIGSCLGSANDCDDNNADIYPGNPEICDGLDNNCNGMSDEGLTFDLDGDGRTSIGSCQGTANDCDDNNADIYPGNPEICDGLDNDCDFQVDEGLTFDLDGDGYTGIGSCGGTANDCNDNNAAIHPGSSPVQTNVIPHNPNSVTVYWSNITGSTNYMIRYRLAGGFWTEATHYRAWRRLYGLVPCESYETQFKNYIMGQWNCWSDTFYFSTPCVRPFIIGGTKGAEISSTSYLELYPNPNSGEEVNVEIHTQTAQNLYWTLRDLSGKTVQKGETKLTEGFNNFIIQNDDLPAGVYFFKAPMAEGVKVVKMIVE